MIFIYLFYKSQLMAGSLVDWYLNSQLRQVSNEKCPYVVNIDDYSQDSD